MELVELKLVLRELIQEVSKENFTQYYEHIKQPILKFKESGGLGKPIYDYLNLLNNEFAKNEYQHEVITEIVNCLVGYCAPYNIIAFPDFNPELSRWKTNTD